MGGPRYRLQAEPLAAPVHFTGTGRWCAADGVAEGHGMVSLAMWREGVGVRAAPPVLSDMIERAGAAAPTGSDA